MRALQERQQLLRPELLRVLKLDAHPLGKGLVARGDGVPQIANRDQAAEAELIAPLDEEGQHQLQRRALTLQHGGGRDQRLHQRRAEGIDLAEHAALAIGAEQRVHDVPPPVRELLEGRVELDFRSGVLRAEQAPLRDDRQVPVLKVDPVEARLPVAERIGELQL